MESGEQYNNSSNKNSYHGFFNKYTCHCDVNSLEDVDGIIRGSRIYVHIFCSVLL